MSKPEPAHGYTADGVPIWHLVNGKRACGAHRHWDKNLGPKPENFVGEPCKRTIGLLANGRCKLHGRSRGRAGKAVGMETLKAIRTRDQVLGYIAEKDPSGLGRPIDKIYESEDPKDQRWLVEMSVGGPKQTVITEIGNADLLAKFVSVTRQYLADESEFEKWLLQMQEALEN